MNSEKNIQTFFTQDHDELDGFLTKYQELKHQNFAEAKPYFRKFKFGLQRHIIWEEEILFPFFENKTGMKDAGPTVVMRQEHKIILASLERLHLKVKAADPDSGAEEIELLEVLQTHNLKEEQVLYPYIQQMATPQEQNIIFMKMEEAALPEERTCGCHHQD